MSTDNNQVRLMVTKGTIADSIRSIETEIGSAVIDKTGITGVFDFTVEFTRDTGRTINQFAGLPQAQPSATAASTGNESPGLRPRFRRNLV